MSLGLFSTDVQATSSDARDSGLVYLILAALLATVAGTAHAASPTMDAGVLLWADPVDPNKPAPAPEAWPDSALSRKSAATAPTHLRWAVLRCNFQGSPGHPRTQAQIRRLFEKPDVGVFAFYDRQSRGLLTQEIAWVADVQLPRSWGSYWSNATYTGAFLDATTNDCLQGAARDLRDITGVAVFYNDNIDCCAYGSPYQMDDGEEVRRVSGIWVPANASHVASIVAHELAHSLSVSHSNNSDGDWDTTDNAWDIMSSHHRNALRDSELVLLPHSFHPYDRQLLGWLGNDELLELNVGEGPDRSESFVLRAGQLLRLHFDAQRGMTVHFRGVGEPDDGLRTEPAVFIDELGTGRREPLWVVDDGVPMPGFADTDTSYFTAGESWVVEEAVLGRALMVDIVSVSADEATVRVHLGPPPPPVELFASDFESNPGSHLNAH